MARYMFLQRSTGCEQQPEMSAEQREQAMQSWMEWMKTGQEQGWLVDPGSGLKPGGSVVSSDLTVTDGPLIESKEIVGGYSIVEADSLARACELAKLTMQLAGNGRIEVREIMAGGD